jgi:hypothetical protein
LLSFWRAKSPRRQHRYVESRKSIGRRPGACLALPDRGTTERDHRRQDAPREVDGENTR